MGQRGRTTFQKRQKEMARREKQMAKAKRREERKTQTEGSSPESQFATVEDITGIQPIPPDTEPHE